MDNYTATELAYKNGYEQGEKDALRRTVSEMKKCDPRAYAACAYKSDCGPLGEAEYADGSECEQFNEEMVSRPRTNADTIRSMSDEELGVFLEGVGYDAMEHRSGWWVNWLQKPAEEGGGDDGAD